MSELTLALKIIKEYCGEQSSDNCNECPLYPVCYEELEPMCLDIPEPPPEQTERPRIEWLRMLPDGEMAKAMDNMQNGYCSSCEYCLECSCDVDSPCNKGHMDWWHEVVSLEQFRKDVKLE